VSVWVLTCPVCITYTFATMASSNMEVGSVVRARRPQNPKTTGRAIVATLQDDKSVCLLWEPFPPKPILSLGGQKSSNENNQKIFLVSPIRAKEQEGEETIVNILEVQELLLFEKLSSTESSEDSNVSLWKDRGDQLLRLGDASSAASYYEAAISKSSTISIGGTIVVQIKGFPKIAEVDCVEDESVDVTIVDSGDEATIPKSEILLGLLEPDNDKLQERILLNLARCMLHLSEIDTMNRPGYLKSAVLACSLVVTISPFHEGQEHHADDTNERLSANAQTALLLRAKAQADLSKWPNAMADAKKLIRAGNEQGRKLLESFERKKKQRAKLDKKLSKAVCRWVQTATAESVSDNCEESSITPESPQEVHVLPEARRQTKQSLISSSLLSIIIIPLIATFLIQKMIFGK
jgi:hypothetical protein